MEFITSAAGIVVIKQQNDLKIRKQNRENMIIIFHGSPWEAKLQGRGKESYVLHSNGLII